MADFKIMRNGLNTEIVGDPRIGQSSEDVTVAVTDDGTYQGYDKKLYYSYGYKRQIYRAIADENSNGEFIIPMAAFLEPGIVKLSLELSNGTNKPTCNTCFIRITEGAKLVAASDILPNEESWQSYIQSYIKSNPEKFKGDTGPQGEKGEKGDKGDSGQPTNGSITEEKINSNFLYKIKNVYITPEMFGAIGDGITDDTEALKQSIKYASENGVKLTAGKNASVYKITSTIEFDNVFVENIGTIKCESAGITVKNHSIVRYFTLLNGPLLCDAYYSEVGHFTIKNYDGTCISFQSTTELPDKSVGYDGIHDFTIDNYELHTKNAVGIHCNNNDMKIRNGVIINCNTGIIYDGGNILLDKIHMWVNSYVDFDTTVAFDIRTTGFRINDCTVDTYKTIFKMGTTYLQGTVNGMNIIHNITLRPNVSIYFITNQYCTIFGDITVRMTGWKSHNVSYYQVDNAKCNIIYIDGQPVDGYRLKQADIVSTFGAETISTSKVNIIKSLVDMDISLSYKNGMPYGQKDEIDISKLICAYRLSEGFSTLAYYADSTTGNFSLGTAHIDINNSKITISGEYNTVGMLRRVFIKQMLEIN